MNAERLQSLFKLVVRVLSNPGSDPRAAALVIGAIAAIALILVLVLFLAFTPRTRRIVKTVYYPADAEIPPEALSGASEEPAEKTPRAPRRPLPKWLAVLVGPALVPVLVLAALVGAYAATSTNDYCARSCHRDQDTVSAAEKIDHARCIQCHTAPGVAGGVEGVSDRLRMVASWAGRSRPDGVRAVVGSDSCIRCHENVLTGVSASSVVNVRMKHQEPLDAGMTCVDCHGRVGHLAKRRAVSMSYCVKCHDGKRASAECGTCHTSDIGTTERSKSVKGLGSGKYTYPTVTVSNIGCGGCHDQARQCDTCHKLRMPHPASFLAGYHARYAAFEKKTLCWRCHVQGDCSKCHVVPFESGHNPGWKAEHSASPADSTCKCHERGSPLAPGQMCRYCHGPVLSD